MSSEQNLENLFLIFEKEKGYIVLIPLVTSQRREAAMLQAEARVLPWGQAAPRAGVPSSDKV